MLQSADKKAMDDLLEEDDAGNHFIKYILCRDHDDSESGEEDKPKACPLLYYTSAAVYARSQFKKLFGILRKSLDLVNLSSPM